MGRREETREKPGGEKPGGETKLHGWKGRNQEGRKPAGGGGGGGGEKPPHGRPPAEQSAVFRAIASTDGSHYAFQKGEKDEIV